MQTFWVHVTDCGDAAVTLPLALLTFVVLCAARERRLAAAWVLAIGGCAVAMGVLKLIFGACGSRLAPVSIVSPSGHAGMSAAVYLSLALLVGASLKTRLNRVLLAAAILLVGGIAVSRVALDLHGVFEVAIGLVVGLVAAGFFRAALRRQPPPAVPVMWLGLAALVVVVVMHGTRLVIEPAVHSVARAFRLALPWCR